MEKNTNDIGFLPQASLKELGNSIKFGLSEFTTKVYRFLRSGKRNPAFGWTANTSNDHINRITHLLEEFETDLPTIKKKQEIAKALIKDKSLVTFLLETEFPDYRIRRGRDEEFSPDNDDVAVQTVEYLTKLQKLIAKNAAYSGFRTKLNRLVKENSFLEHFNFLAAKNKQFSNAAITIKLEFTRREDYNKYANIDMQSQEYFISIGTDKSIIPVASNLYGSLKIEKAKRISKKRSRVTRFDLRQETESLQRDQWGTLIAKFINDSYWKDLLKLSTDQSLIVTLNVKASLVGTPKITAVIKNHLSRVKKYHLVTYLYDNKKLGKNQVAESWLTTGKRFRKSKETIDTEYRQNLNRLKESAIFINSRYYINSRLNEIKQMFWEIQPLVDFAALAAYFRDNPNVWVFPTMLPMKSQVTEITNCTNPLFFSHDNDKQKVNVPNNVMFQKKNQGKVITGANAGGKTAYANMIALNQVFAQAGLPVFAKEATMSVKDNILCHYIESSDIGVNSSRYQSELHRLRNIVEKVTPHSLVIFDEPFSGTSVEDGTDQAHQVLKVLNKVNCMFIMSTHFHDLVDKVGNNGTTGIRNMHFLPVNPEKPTAQDYKILEGGIKVSQGALIAINEKVDYASMLQVLKGRKVLTE